MRVIPRICSVSLGRVILRGVVITTLACEMLTAPAAAQPGRASSVSTRALTSLDLCWSDGSGTYRDPTCERHRSRVMEQWRTYRSYYALLEIVEGRLEPGLGRLTRAQVIDLLGASLIDRDYPNSRKEGFLVWGASRMIPQGGYLVVRFDQRNTLRSYDWVSE
jgi:hypothetical protein